jgi:hypothetical protein
MATRTELIHRTLRNLGALPQGQSPSNEDSESISDIIDWTVAELEKRDVVYIADVDNLESEFVQPLAHIIAWRAAPEFGAASDQALAALAVQAEMHLKNMESARPTYTIAEDQYF